MAAADSLAERRAASLTKLAICGLCLATLLLAAVYAWQIPLRTDGGWYSYPGFALADGRDASENLLPPEELRDGSHGIRATFGWENRTSLLVLTHAGWFKIAGSTSSSIRAFQILQWLLLSAAVAAGAWVLTRNRAAALAIGLVAASDSWVMSESLSDLRPDAPLAVISMVCLAAIVLYCRSFKARYALLAICAAASMLLMHATGAIPFAGCCAFIGIYVLAAYRRRVRVPWLLLGAVLAGGAAFLWRLQIFDVLIPTRVPAEFQEAVRYDYLSKVFGAYADGVGAKLHRELLRWLDYIFVTNALHGLVIIGGLALTWRGRSTAQAGSAGIESVAIVAAFAAALLTSTILNPHIAPGQLLSLVCIGYVAAAPGVAAVLARRDARLVGAMVVSMILGIAALRAAHATNTYIGHREAGISIASVEALMRDTVTAASDQMAIAPTTVWPYIPGDASVVLMDERSRPWPATSSKWHGVSLLVIDREYLDNGWGSVVADLEACGAVEDVGAVGHADRGYYLRSMRLVKAGCPAS
jgi:hypothetical protein